MSRWQFLVAGWCWVTGKISEPEVAQLICSLGRFPADFPTPHLAQVHLRLHARPMLGPVFWTKIGVEVVDVSSFGWQSPWIKFYVLAT